MSDPRNCLNYSNFQVKFRACRVDFSIEASDYPTRTTAPINEDFVMHELAVKQEHTANLPSPQTNDQEQALVKARRTAFVARFIVLREAKRTKAHRIIELMSWEDAASAEDLCARFRQVFVDNGDNMQPVDRDLRRALSHASRSLNYFISEYSSRSTANFIDALIDYERSNSLLFGSDEQPKPGGWRLPRELLKIKNEGKSKTPKA